MSCLPVERLPWNLECPQWSVADGPLLASTLATSKGANWGGSRLFAPGAGYRRPQRLEMGGKQTFNRIKLTPPDKEARMYRVILECLGVPADEGAEAATDIERDFREHRTHHHNVRCTFESGKLILQAENDFDPNGCALMDEFSDQITANVSPFDGDLRFVSSTPI